jgi:predicted benzoate:H+ symporter BenE
LFLLTMMEQTLRGVQVMKAQGLSAELVVTKGLSARCWADGIIS